MQRSRERRLRAWLPTCLFQLQVRHFPAVRHSAHRQAVAEGPQADGSTARGMAGFSVRGACVRACTRQPVLVRTHSVVVCARAISVGDVRQDQIRSRPRVVAYSMSSVACCCMSSVAPLRAMTCSNVALVMLPVSTQAPTACVGAAWTVASPPRAPVGCMPCVLHALSLVRPHKL